ncbi:MAG: SMP-30/gluconolactonase/LRE family protein [Rhodospirillaceae bacterium]|jgi:L-arabinonolactonase|nr:SMP-30/gluconolactonase/LRE family protein [Rhodospirillaceae bacterium]
MALRQSGGAVVVMDNGFHSLDFETGKTVALAEPEAANEETGFNDCKVDRQGRLVGGSLHTEASEPRGSIFRLDADHSCTQIGSGMIESNGPCFSPDGRTFYIAGSYAEVIYAFDYDVVTGGASNRRVFYSSAGTGGQPDGATVDAEGHVWSAQFGAGKINRIKPDGTVVRVIDVPVKWVSCMTFGGENNDVLYVTSIGCEIAGERDPTPEAGGLFVIHGLGVQGPPEPRFAG